MFFFRGHAVESRAGLELFHDYLFNLADDQLWHIFVCAITDSTLAIACKEFAFAAFTVGLRDSRAVSSLSACAIRPRARGRLLSNPGGHRLCGLATNSA